MQRLRWKRNIARFWPSRSKGKKIILLYHSVGSTTWGLAESEFDLQMSWLANHCSVKSLTDLIQSPFDDTIQVALTFDDGYSSLYDSVSPILARKKLQAMVYINTGWIGHEIKDRKQSVSELGHYPNESFLIWPEVKELHQQGWEIGSHGVNHFDFTQLNYSTALNELQDSKKNIEENLSSICSHFSYPWGKYNAQVKNAVKQAGFKYASAARHGIVVQDTELFCIPRINIDKNYSFKDFKNIIEGKWDFLGLVHAIKGL